MQRVTTGDLSMRLAADENGDELDVISTQFNEMCQAEVYTWNIKGWESQGYG